MMQFKLSRQLTKLLAKHMKPAKNISALFTWHAVFTTIGDNQCIIVRDANTGYVMIFCGMSEADFNHFKSLFRDRFWREASALIPNMSKQDRLIFNQHMTQICANQHYHFDPRTEDEGPLTAVIEKLERRVIIDNKPLPMDGKSAFEFTLPINSRVSKSKAESTSALDKFRMVCAAASKDMAREATRVEDASSPILSRVDNIVTVKFGKNR